jgi:hypothetical protein
MYGNDCVSLRSGHEKLPHVIEVFDVQSASNVFQSGKNILCRRANRALLLKFMLKYYVSKFIWPEIL